MKNLKTKVAAAWSKVPASVKTQGWHVALTFAVAFAAVAAPAIPALVQNVEGGKLPDMDVVHALVVAAIAAGVKAAIPVARASVVLLVGSFTSWVKTRKSDKLQKAVEAYLVVKAAADAQKVADEAAKAAVVQAVPVVAVAPVAVPAPPVV